MERQTDAVIAGASLSSLRQNHTIETCVSLRFGPKRLIGSAGILGTRSRFVYTVVPVYPKTQSCGD